jgi:hypothetical protein
VVPRLARAVQRDGPMRALVVLLLAVSGCALHHERDQSRGGIAAGPEFDVPERASATPVPAGTCVDASFVELLPPGGIDVRYASLAPLGDGLFLTYEDNAHGFSPERSFAGPLAAWRSEPLWVEDIGRLTSPTGDVAATLEAGGDGLLAACAAYTWLTTPSGSELVPGGVTFLRPDGSVERHVPFTWDCADVAFVAGHWVAIEVGGSAVRERERNLVIFDAALEPIARVSLGLASGSHTDERVIEVAGRAVVAIRRERDIVGFHDLSLVSIDVEAAVTLDERTLPMLVWPADGRQRFDIAARGDRIHVVAAEGDGDPVWIELDASLEVARDPVVIEDVVDNAGNLDVEVLPRGLVVGWSEGVLPRFSPLVLALLDDETGAITRVEAGIPGPESTILGDWLDIAVQGDFVAISILLSDSRAGRLSNWIWGARCAAY